MVLISAAKKMVSATISTLLRPGDWIQITSKGRQGDDRDGLRGDQVGRQQPFQPSGVGQEVAQHQRGAQAQQHAGEDLQQRQLGVIPQGAVWRLPAGTCALPRPGAGRMKAG